ncbi:hypothetical protein E1162_07335 [Rhodobacteraceae bacterium RKSG542]|nr:hypothetical protein [Pseudovibrio flavus]
MLLALGLVTADVAVASASCLSPQQTRQAVNSGQARPLGSLNVGGGQIVSAQLCQRGRGLVYVLKVLKNGKVQNVTVDAKSGRATR